MNKPVALLILLSLCSGAACAQGGTRRAEMQALMTLKKQEAAEVGALEERLAIEQAKAGKLFAEASARPPAVREELRLQLAPSNDAAKERLAKLLAEKAAVREKCRALQKTYAEDCARRPPGEARSLREAFKRDLGLLQAELARLNDQYKASAVALRAARVEALGQARGPAKERHDRLVVQGEAVRRAQQAIADQIEAVRRKFQPERYRLMNAVSPGWGDQLARVDKARADLESAYRQASEALIATICAEELQPEPSAEKITRLKDQLRALDAEHDEKWKVLKAADKVRRP